jgi:hypothetical protein
MFPIYVRDLEGVHERAKQIAGEAVVSYALAAGPLVRCVARETRDPDFSKTIRIFMVLMVSANGADVTSSRWPRHTLETIDCKQTEIEPDDRWTPR